MADVEKLCLKYQSGHQYPLPSAVMLFTGRGGDVQARRLLVVGFAKSPSTHRLSQASGTADEVQKMDGVSQREPDTHVRLKASRRGALDLAADRARGASNLQFASYWERNPIVDYVGKSSSMRLYCMTVFSIVGFAYRAVSGGGIRCCYSDLGQMGEIGAMKAQAPQKATRWSGLYHVVAGVIYGLRRRGSRCVNGHSGGYKVAAYLGNPVQFDDGSVSVDNGRLQGVGVRVGMALAYRHYTNLERTAITVRKALDSSPASAPRTGWISVEADTKLEGVYQDYRA